MEKERCLCLKDWWGRTLIKVGCSRSSLRFWDKFSFHIWLNGITWWNRKQSKGKLQLQQYIDWRNLHNETNDNDQVKQSSVGNLTRWRRLRLKKVLRAKHLPFLLMEVKIMTQKFFDESVSLSCKNCENDKKKERLNWERLFWWNVLNSQSFRAGMILRKNRNSTMGEIRKCWFLVGKLKQEGQKTKIGTPCPTSGWPLENRFFLLLLSLFVCLFFFVFFCCPARWAAGNVGEVQL